MERSFLEYRDKSGVDSDSDDDVIDNSLLADDSFTATPIKKTFMKTPAKENRTVFVAESAESSAEDEPVQKIFPKIVRKSSAAHSNMASSEDERSRRGSIRHVNASFNRVVLSSSEEEVEVSPEIVPKRRPPIRVQSTETSDTSPIGRRKNKRMILLDSDTDNSIVIEHNKNKKLTCLKDTPLKVEVGNARKAINDSIMESDAGQSDSDESQSDSDESQSDSDDKNMESDAGQSDNDDKNSKSGDETESDDEPLCNLVKKQENKPKFKNGEAQNDESQIVKKSQSDSHLAADTDHNMAQKRKNKNFIDESDTEQSDTDENESDSDQSEGDAGLEDQLVMSRATRMSIMGVAPPGEESDESDFITSDEKSRSSSAASSLPDVSAFMSTTHHEKPVEPQHQKLTEPNNDTSTLICSPFTSPLHDVTNDIGSKRAKNGPRKVLDKGFKDEANENFEPDEEVTFIGEYTPKTDKRVAVLADDDVTIIDTKTEVIALSSDDDEPPMKPAKKSPRAKPEAAPTTKQNTKGKENTMKQYLQPPSYPNQVVFVKKHVLENELSKLEGLKQDLHHLKYMMDTMDLSSLPDNGRKLIDRLTELEKQLRVQGDKVATLVIEPDEPTPSQMANDGFEPYKPSWEDLQKGSQAVQPRMFGKQAMATHMAERNLILERLRLLHESLDSCPNESSRAARPSTVRADLMPHQLHALAWLQWRETQRPCGGILADDMGLGKTIQMISLVVSDKDGAIHDEDDDSDSEDMRGRTKMTRGGTLVVCPASLIQQWEGEVKKHCTPHALSVCLHHGPSRATHPHRLATHDLVLTTYNILQRDNEKSGVLMKMAWRRIILDEAHIVRNHKSATSMAVSALKGRRRWCLTGTPVHNKDLDLFALLKFLRCTPFDELTMWKKWIDNKSAGGQERLNTIMRCILLRRTKVQLQQKGQLDSLPERTAHQNEVTLDTDEMNVYQKVMVLSKTLFAQFLHQRAEKQGDAGAGNDAYYKMHKRMIALHGAKPVKSHEILVLLLRLRQVCCHCGLIAAMLDERNDDEDVRSDPAGEDLLDELNKMTLDDSKRKDPNEDEEGTVPEETTTVKEAIRSVLSPNNPVFGLDRQSSKIRAVMDCLAENVFSNNGDKAVVVSQWTSVLRLVETQLRRARVRSVTLSGAVPVPQRAQLIDQLNNNKSDVKVMLLSLCAGGVGLNLCGANHLLLLDPHWNPQLEEQAQDRVYRLGQTKPVHVYRFMCVDTVEQSIRKLQASKLALAENVLTGAKNTNASKLTIEDLKMLFNMGQDDPQLT